MQSVAEHAAVTLRPTRLVRSLVEDVVLKDAQYFHE